MQKKKKQKGNNERIKQKPIRMGTQELKGENTRVNAESKVRIPQMPLILRVRLWDYMQVLFNWKPVHLKKKKKKRQAR